MPPEFSVGALAGFAPGPCSGGSSTGAVGVLTGRLEVSPSQAFDILRVLSQHTNRKLADIADHLVETVDLPEVDGRPHH